MAVVKETVTTLNKNMFILNNKSTRKSFGYTNLGIKFDNELYLLFLLSSFFGKGIWKRIDKKKGMSKNTKVTYVKVCGRK